MSAKEYSNSVNQENNNNEVIPPTLNFESLSRSILANDSRQKPELFFKHQNRNPFLKEKRIIQDQATEPSDASDINTNTNINTKAPNVFASPHFRTRTRLSFKEFQKKEVNNPQSLSAAQNNITSLFFEKKIIPENEILNQGKSSDQEKTAEHSNQELSVHDKSNDTFDQTPSIQRKFKKTSDQESCVDHSLLDNPSPQSQDKFLVHDTESSTCTNQTTSSFKNDDFQIDYNEIKDSIDIPKGNEKDIIKKSNLFNKSLPENYQSSFSNNNDFHFPGKPSRNSLSSRVQEMQGSHTKVNDQQPKHIFPIAEQGNSEIKDNLSNDNDLNLIVEAVQRWKDEVARRDCLIGELRGQAFTLRDALDHKEHSLSHYRERMFLVESMVKRQNSYTERSRKRINDAKLKYSLFRNLLCNMGKNIEEICNQKERIEKEIESMRLEFSKLTTKHKSILDNHAAVSQTQQAQFAQIADFNAQLNNIMIQLRRDIQEMDNKASRSSSDLDAIRLKLEDLLSELERERSAHAKESQKLKLEFERVEEDNRNLVKSNKENEEKIASLAADIELEIESNQSERTRLNSIINEKDGR